MEFLNKNVLKTSLLILLTSLPFLSLAQQWESLFNGINFEGWNQKNGSANYEVIDSAVVGSPVMNTPNSFMCTNKLYSDFIFELEVKLDGGLNSGIQFRSNSFPEYKNGRVHGYQCELDPSDRKWTAGVYDESRRGWIYKLEDDPLAQSAFKVGEWNKIRIEAIGASIRTWVNGTMCTNLEDGLTAEGFFGLQVHSIKKKSQLGNKVRWRNIRILEKDLERYRWPVAAHAQEVVVIPNAQ